MGRLLRGVTIGLALVVLAGCAGVVRIQPADGGPALPATLATPKGDGPFPAVVLLHGCNGPRARNASWAAKLVSAGYVTLAVNSFSPRGISGLCSDVPAMTMAIDYRVRDAKAALAYLESQPFVDARRIGVIGWSHGGWTVLATLSDTSAGQFAAGIAFYPSCRQWSRYTFQAPLLVLIGSDDDWTRAAYCEQMQRAKVRDGQPLVLKVYNGATHDFDDRANVRPATYLGHRFVYDGAATKDAESRVLRFLAEHLR